MQTHGFNDWPFFFCFPDGIEAEKSDAAVDREADLDNVAIQGLRPIRREISYHRKRQLIMSNEPIGWRRPSRSNMGEWLCLGSPPCAPFVS